MGLVKTNHPSKCKPYLRLALTTPTSISTPGLKDTYTERTAAASADTRSRILTPAGAAAATIVKRIGGEAVGAAWPCDFRAAAGRSCGRFYSSSGSLRRAQCDPLQEELRATAL